MPVFLGQDPWLGSTEWEEESFPTTTTVPVPLSPLRSRSLRGLSMDTLTDCWPVCEGQLRTVSCTQVTWPKFGSVLLSLGLPNVPASCSHTPGLHLQTRTHASMPACPPDVPHTHSQPHACAWMSTPWCMSVLVHIVGAIVCILDLCMTCILMFVWLCACRWMHSVSACVCLHEHMCKSASIW